MLWTAAIGTTVWRVRAQRQLDWPDLQETSLREESVVGSNPVRLGNAQAPMTVVEFGDYECPPCRSAFGRLKEWVDSGKVGLVFRHLPLTDIHPYAFDAATAAEAAKLQGKFDSMHRLLYEGKLDGRTIIGHAKRLGLDLGRFTKERQGLAKDLVEADRRAAKSMGLTSTPSFLLCLRGGTVLKPASLDSLSRYVAANP